MNLLGCTVRKLIYYQTSLFSRWKEINFPNLWLLLSLFQDILFFCSLCQNLLHVPDRKGFLAVSIDIFFQFFQTNTPLIHFVWQRRVSLSRPHA